MTATGEVDRAPGAGWAGLVLRRSAGTLALLLLVVSATFFLLEALPGGPGVVPEDARVPRDQAERLRSAWGLDRPLVERYFRFLGSALVGEWGPSFTHQRSAARVVADALPWTLLLAVAALAVELLLGLVLGVAAARWPEGFFDRATRAVTLALRAIPGFWLALLLLALFAVRWPVLPAGGVGAWSAGEGPTLARFADLFRHLLLPALALGLPAAAGSARFVRAALLEIAGEPFIAAARARGLPRRTVALRHALRAAAAPLVQQLGFSLGGLLSGALAVEVVFAWPGLGRVAFDALGARDYPVLLAGATLSAVAVLAGSLAAELAHAALDPRVRDA